jgi:RNA polymerase sigma-70 factor (ECF subfamily)
MFLSIHYNAGNKMPDSGMDTGHLKHEKEIIAASKKDPHSFRPLYEYYFHPVFNYIYQKTNEINAASDITSSVFYNALIHIDKYQDRNLPFGAWLFKIAYNETMQYFRRSKNTRYVVLDDHLIENMADELESNNKARLLQATRQIMETLAPSEVEIIELKYFQQKSNRETAFILGISEGNLKVKAHRITQKIRKLIEKENERL